MKQRNLYLLITFTALLCWGLWNYEATLGLLGRIRSIFMPFIIGGVIAFIVNIFLVRLELLWSSRLQQPWLMRLRRPLCLLLSMCFIAAFLAFVLLLVLPELQASVRTLVKLLPVAVQQLNLYLQEKALQLHIDKDEVQFLQQQANEMYQTLRNYLQSNKSVLLARTFSATASVFDALTNVVIGLVAAVYLLLDKERVGRGIKRVVYAYCSEDRAAYLVQAAATADRIFTGFVGGQLAEALLLGCMYFVGMKLFGFPYALIVSLLVAVLGLIPILGTLISAVIGCFLILVTAPEKIWPFLIFFVVLQRIEGDLLYPKIVGRAVGLSALWVLVAVTIGASIGGIWGMLLSVPLCSVLYTLAAQQIKERLHGKNLQDL